MAVMLFCGHRRWGILYARLGTTGVKAPEAKCEIYARVLAPVLVDRQESNDLTAFIATRRGGLPE
jgi:hypothetical protein